MDQSDIQTFERYVYRSKDPRLATAEAESTAETRKVSLTVTAEARLAIREVTVTAAANPPAELVATNTAEAGRARRELTATVTAKVSELRRQGLRSQNCGHTHENDGQVHSRYDSSIVEIAENELLGFGNSDIVWNAGCSPHFGTHGSGDGQHRH